MVGVKLLILPVPPCVHILAVAVIAVACSIRLTVLIVGFAEVA